MPIYEYKCEKCGNEFEEIVIGSAEDVKCPACGSDKTGRLMSRCRHKSAGGAAVSLGEASSAPSGGCAGCSGGDCSSCGS